jgi:hypothetical protein
MKRLRKRLNEWIGSDRGNGMKDFFGAWRVLYHIGRVSVSMYLLLLAYGLSDRLYYGTVQVALNEITGGFGSYVLAGILLGGVIFALWPGRRLSQYAVPLISLASYVACLWGAFIWYALVETPRDPVYLIHPTAAFIVFMGVVAGVALVGTLTPYEGE